MLFLYLVASSGRGLDLPEGAIGDCWLFIALFIDGGFLRSSDGLTINCISYAFLNGTCYDYESSERFLTY